MAHQLPPALASIPAGEARERLLCSLVSDVYSESPPSLRARLLECLLQPVRPLALAAVAAGAFGGFLHRQPWSRLSVSADEALRFSAEQVFELSRYVEQYQPEALRQIASLLTEYPGCLASLSGSWLATALHLWLP